MAIRKLIVPGAHAPVETPVQALARDNYRESDMQSKQSSIPDDKLDELIKSQNERIDEQERSNVRAPRRQKITDGEYKRRDLLQEVTDKMSQSIEEGTAPWQQPDIGRFGWPKNATTDKPYHGINVLLLATAGFPDPRWCTYEQAKKKGWQVRKDEKSTRIYFYKMEPRNTDKLDPATSLPILKFVPVFKSYSLFNLAQIDKAPAPDLRSQTHYELSDLTEQTIIEIIDATGVEIRSGEAPAYLYDDDAIVMPEMNTFQSDGHYYSALLKELVHWTGHETRLNRAFSLNKAAPEYLREELRADMASAMISMQLGLPAADFDESRTSGYLTLLKSDKKEVFRAAKDAESISRFILRYDPEMRVKLEAEVKEQSAAATDAGSPDEFFDASLFDEFDDAPVFKP